ncbi:beta propeller domain protein [Seminavis robusta]|uniref:Beta propeller domain protein n=1 Tax=Seminavis robusta TaxID=568900 RepID=A0A9N8HK30_9STRA|nr:beta propeller domain protein [Seminavis robusta]|eukprot:Sro807_g205300.1 beta propeller domain protein (927) ;mRNA; f:33871-36651
MGMEHDDEGMPESPYLDEEGGFDEVDSKSTQSSSGVGFGDDSTEKRRSPNRRRVLFFLGLASLLVVAVTVTVVVVVATKKGDNGTKSSASTSNGVQGSSPLGPGPGGSTSGGSSAEETTNTVTIDSEPSTETPQDNQDQPESATVDAPNFYGLDGPPVPSFSKNVIQPYKSREALEEDLRVAATDMVRNLLVQQATLIDDTAEGTVGATDTTRNNNSGRRLFNDKVANSRSVNQEDNVDEADSVKEDGNFVYAAYGDHLVVWDRRGNMVTDEKMPLPPMNEYGTHNNPWIQAIQLTEKHVLVFVGGYGVAMDGGITFVQNETKVHVYLKPTVEQPLLTLVATDYLNGHYLDSRYVEETQSVHVISGTDIDVFSNLRAPLDPASPLFEGLNQTQYIEQASKLAKETVIPTFVTKMAEEILRSNRGQLPPLLQINDWTLDRRRNNHEMPGKNPTAALDEAFRAYIQIHSIDPNDLPVDSFVENDLKLVTTGFLGPSAHPSIVAAADSIVVSVDRFDYNQETESSNSTVFLLHLKIAPATPELGASFQSVGVLRGKLPDRYSVDIHGNDLRVVATSQKFNPYQDLSLCGDYQPPVLASAWTGDSCLTHENWAVCHNLVVLEGCENLVKNGCPYTFTCGDASATGESSTENFVVVYDMMGTEGEMIERGRARFGSTHESVQSISFGPEFVYVVTSFDKTNGPFYLIELPPGQSPNVKSSFELETVPSYLQSINDDGTLVVGIGTMLEGANLLSKSENGVVANVYDLSVPGQAVVVATKLLNEDPLALSKTSASYDPKAVQYTSSGLLLVPLTLSPDLFAIFEAMDPTAGYVPMDQLGKDQVFEGFVVLDVSKAKEGQGIVELFRVNHAAPSGSCHHCNGYLSNHRSFVYEEYGSVMTMYSHVVTSTDLSTLEQIWAFNVTIEDADMSCCF